MWEKVDWRVAPRRSRGVGRIVAGARLVHPSYVAFGDTFSHKGRKGSQPANPSNRLRSAVVSAREPARRNHHQRRRSLRRMVVCG
ncbi:conserved hypothetical protein [Mesorhizobium delmotii]|uniref:Uncharacterized protein n=1 Tax=Mesorhizobium delmotii TaxID=1631247 RepID=A0A2P9AF60_9HYPH|nr:conserved hypothetical protein [Mesorhizobium delmotii]